MAGGWVVIDSAPAMHGTRSQAQYLLTQDAEGQQAESSIRQQQVQRTRTQHDIFLSHSGSQKGFVKDLYKQLTQSSYTTFFDITHHSLPPAEKFPPRIIEAAKSCSLALVVLSEEFVSSKWPMVELCTFVDSIDSGVHLKLLPLFYKLSPADLKAPENLERWRKSWEALAEKDYKGRIDVSKWTRALQILCAHNGIRFNDPHLEVEGEQTYIDRIVLAVSQVIPPAFKFDTTYISGKDRLSKVILDKFEEMELYQSGMSTLVDRGGSSSRASQPKPCVLGLYGLPGSGKTTLCKCLLDHFRPLYGSSKTHYLEFPSTASKTDVVNKLKELVTHLTNFGNRVSLDGVSDIEHVLDLLKTYQFSSCKVFLVVDNISESSWDAIRRILDLGVGEGSKIILVARTLDVLRPILVKCGLHWACESPSINEMEASEILLKTAKGSHMASLGSLSSKQMKSVKAVVRMCSFGSVWLPLVMKAMGASLLKYEDKGGWEEWESDSENFWTRVKMYKQSAVVEELLGENFKALLNEHLQLVFLDVALFFLQFEWKIETETVCASLSKMHGFTSSKIRMMIIDLARYCFLEVSKHGIIRVHDVYLEFAMSIQDGPSKHLGSTVSSFRWEHCKAADAPEAGSKFLLKPDQNDQVEGGLRALILELGEGYERVDLQGFSALKAVALMNCKSMRVLGLAGLRSLAILEIKKCAKFNIEQLECDDASVQTIKRLCIIKPPASELEEEREIQLEREQASNVMRSIVSAVNRLKMMTPFRQPSSLEVGLLASRLRSLQVLHLQNTGIARLVFGGSSNLCQLQELTVIDEQHLESLGLGYLPSLTHFKFHDSAFHRYSRGLYPDKWRWKIENSRHELVGVQDLLKGCPQLKRVSMASPWFKPGRELGSLPAAGLESFVLHGFNSFELPDLSLSAHTLENLDIAWCQKLGRVNLDIVFERLKFLHLRLCDNLVEITVLACLPNLQKLSVRECMRLQKLISFDNCPLLNELIVSDCPELTEISCLNSLLNWESLETKKCPLSAHTLERLDIAWCQKLGRVSLEIIFIERLKFLQITGLECLPNLRSLSVWKCMRLQKLIGFDNCRLLDRLSLDDCPELTEISCFNSLLNLKDLFILKCPNLEGLLSMHTVCDLEKLKVCSLEVYRGECNLNLRNCKNLGELEIRQHYCALSGIDSPDGAVLKLEDLDNLVNLRVLTIDGGGSSSMDLKVLSTSCLPSLHRLALENLHVLDNVHAIKHLRTLRYASFMHLNNLKSLHGLECLTNVWDLTVESCPLLEELPPLCALVDMETLRVVDCPKLKAVEGCEHMEVLDDACLDGCKSMQCYPFTNLRVARMSFMGCKFVSNNMEQMAAWATEEAKPIALRMACVAALVWEYYHGQYPSMSASLADAGGAALHMKDRVTENLWRCLVRWSCRNELQLHEKVTVLLEHSIDCVNLFLARAVLRKWKVKAAKGELNLVEARSLLHVLDDAGVASLLSDADTLSSLLARFQEKAFIP